MYLTDIIAGLLPVVLQIQIPFSSFSGPKGLRHPFFFCFRARSLEMPETFTACRAFASAQKTLQKTRISKKLADQPIFRKLLFFSVFCGVFCALANARQAAGISVASNLWTWKQRIIGVRGTELRVACGSAPPCAQSKSEFGFVPRDTEESEFFNWVDFRDVLFQWKLSYVFMRQIFMYECMYLCL